MDAFWELSGWDGRFASTVRALFRHPGLLTREFLEGRRARFISPLRLYLMASLVYFLVAAAAPDVKTNDGRSLFLGVRVTPTTLDTTTRPGRVAAAASGEIRDGKTLTSAERETIRAQIDSAPALIKPFLRRMVDDPNGFRSSMVQAIPKMLFVLLPIFAVLVSIFYRGRNYPEHLYFAIHLHAFFFLALTLSAAARFSGSPAIAAVAAFVVFVWMLVYATIAVRRTYGGSLVKTVAKEGAIGVLYGAIALVAFIVTIYVVTLAG